MTSPTEAQRNLALKRKVHMLYDLQRLRLAAGARLLTRPGKPDEPAEKVEIYLHPDDEAVLNERAEGLHREEKAALKDVERHLKTIPFYNDVLSDKTRYKGIGPTMAGVILSEFDIHKADTVSDFWMFAGLAPLPARRCKQCHGVVVERDSGSMEPEASWFKCKEHDDITYSQTYASGQAMRPVKGEKIKYNPFLRTKLVGVLADVLIKLNSPWRKFYDDYKQRKTAAGWGRSDAHRHQAAKRYMIKMLLQDIHIQWRTYLGLPVRPPYQEQYLGHVHKP